MTPCRDYADFAARVELLPSDKCSVEVAATVGVYPMYVVRSASVDHAGPRVALAAGIHGDEPAGVEAVLRVLEHGGETLSAVDAVVMPCINPAGHVNNTRENGAGVDINRSFQDDAAEEVAAVKGVLANLTFDLFIECHEDWEAEEFYTFEAGEPAVAETVMAHVESVCPVSHGRDIYGMRAVNGVVQIDSSFDAHGLRSMALYMRRFHTTRTLTCETPTALPFEQRVAAHMVAIQAALARLRLT